MSPLLIQTRSFSSIKKKELLTPETSGKSKTPKKTPQQQQQQQIHIQIQIQMTMMIRNMENNDNNNERRDETNKVSHVVAHLETLILSRRKTWLYATCQPATG